MAIFGAGSKSFRERKIRYVLKHYFKLQPKKLDLYYSAVVHSSYKDFEDTEGTYERLEFLGDALFGAFVCSWLYHKFPQMNEGELSRLKSKICARKYLNKLAFDLHVSYLIYFSTREGLKENSIPGNTLEALFGAIYLDQGQDKLTQVFDYIFDNFVDLEDIEKHEIDYKSRVVQYCQKQKIRPKFKVLQKKHRKGRDYFTIELEIESFDSVQASGFSKKKAEQLACKKIFEIVHQQGVDI